MPRPKKCRRVCAPPPCDSFAPTGRVAGAAVEMTLDEYETIRLIDLLGCTQEQCAAQMGVARATVQAVYNTARQKLAAVLVEGRRLVIRGGDYCLCPQGRECRGSRACRRCCHRAE